MVISNLVPQCGKLVCLSLTAIITFKPQTSNWVDYIITLKC